MMRVSPRLCLLPLLGIFFGGPAAAQAASPFPTHCAPDEFVYLNARMSRVGHDAKGNLVLTKNGKILSLCADRKDEPYGRFTYRYGAIGNVEMERNASPRSKFSTFSRSTSPHTGEDGFFFSAGKLTYYVTVATGQGSGVSLYVFESGKGIVNLFSGTGLDVDFEIGPAGANPAPGSAVFRVQAPADRF